MCNGAAVISGTKKLQFSTFYVLQNFERESSRCSWCQGIGEPREEDEAQGYPPVSLLGVLSKRMKSFIAGKITSCLNIHRLLSNRQIGFNPNRLTNDILLQMSISRQQSQDKTHDTFIIAVDIAGVVARIWHSCLITKLRNNGVEDGLHLLHGYLRDRFFYLLMNGYSSQCGMSFLTTIRSSSRKQTPTGMTCNDTDHHANVALITTDFHHMGITIAR